MVELIHDLRAELVRANLQRLREEIAEAAQRAGGSRGAGAGGGARARESSAVGEPGPGEIPGAPGEIPGAPVEILAATKYVPVEELPALAAAGVRLVGENRAQDLERKVAAHGELFEWDFIGALQSRRVRAIVPHVRLIHSLASESALAELERHRAQARPGLRVLLQVNVAGEPGKAGIPPAQIGRYLERCALPVAGLMTMPPLAARAERSRRWFAALRELAGRHGLEQLSMGTSQDYLVAVEEGATIVRIGTSLYH
ncbi:MAG TPA: YggS family pyridoxal phosphate enzyme [Solirubrobacteraceae bacterium]|nr:YggS family pyridoxal phosphate enzyme [Solirubrobacteraceae bacterium]